MNGRFRSRLTVLITAIAVIAGTAVPAASAAADETPPPTPVVEPVETPTPDPAPVVDPVETPTPDPTPASTDSAKPDKNQTSAATHACSQITISNVGTITGTLGSTWPDSGTYVYTWYSSTTSTTPATTVATGTKTQTGKTTTYTPVAADYGHFLSFKVVATDAGFDPTTCWLSAGHDYSIYTAGILGINGVLAAGNTLSINSNLTFHQGSSGGAVIPSVTPHYQWFSGTTPVGGDSSAYTLQGSDYNKAISVRATATKGGWVSAAVTSASTSPVQKGTFALVNPVTVSVGATSLQASSVSSSTSLAGTTGSYQWLRNTIAIPGATAQTYVPTSADSGQSISVSLTLKHDGYNNFETISAGKDYAIVATTAPGVIGLAQVGKTPTATPGIYKALGSTISTTETYQWYRQTGSASPVAIPGATSNIYAVVAADLGKALTVRITAKHAPYIAYQTTYSLGVVAIGAIAGNTNVPTVTRAGTFGSSSTPLILTAHRASGDITEPGATVTYAWMRDGTTVISGATALTYKPTAADRGHTISIRVIAKKTGYATAAFFSLGADYGVNTTDAPTYVGGFQVGSTLTAQPQTYTDFFDGTISPTVTYQWLRNGVAISGATSVSYATTSADFGKRISVKITAKYPGFIPYTGTTAQTPALGLGQFGGALNISITSSAGTTGPILTTLAQGLLTGSGAITYHYQWLRNGSAISGATHTTYTPVAADYNTQTSVRVTATETNFATVTGTSTSHNFSVLSTIAAPVITGEQKIGQTLTASTAGAVFSTNPGGTFGGPLLYQWYRNGAPISGATGNTYATDGSDTGKAITVKTTMLYLGGFLYQPWIATSVPTQALASQSLVGWDVALPPVVHDAGTLNLHITGTGITTTGVTVKYQWLRNGAAISGATTANYTMTAADSQKQVAVRVTISKAGFTTVVKTSLGIDYSLHIATPPYLSTNAYHAQVGAAVNFYGDSWADALGASVTGYTYAYQWLRNDVAISGATGPSYVPVAADLNKFLNLRLTASKAGYVSGTITLMPLQVLTGVFSSGNGFAAPTVNHDLSTGLLTAVIAPNEISDPNPVFSYRWLRDGTTTVGTAATYQPVAADSGHTIALKVTVTKPYFEVRDLGTTPAVDYSLTETSPLGVYDFTTSGGSTISVGDKLLISNPTVSAGGSPVSASGAHQWLRNGVAIPGETNGAYFVQSADFGKTISVRDVLTYPGYIPLTLTSPSTSAVVAGLLEGSGAAPTVEASPTGLLSVTLTSGSITTDSVTLAYKWYRSGTTAPIATTATYQLAAADWGHSIHVDVTASKTHTTPAVFPLASSASIDYSVVGTVLPALTTTTPKVGDQIGLGSSMYTVDGGSIVTPTFTYQWYRSGVAISGATTAPYGVVVADFGKTLSVKITASYPGHIAKVTTTPVTSAVTAGVTTGVPSVDVTLDPATMKLTASLHPGELIPATPAPVLAYKWLRDGTAVAGQTAATYQLTAADYDKGISVVVTMTRAHFTAPTTVLEETVERPYSLDTNGSVNIGGTLKVDQYLSVIAPSDFVDRDGLVPVAPAVAYQWYRNGVALGGQTSDTYLAVAADLGNAITVKVTASAPGLLPWIETTPAVTVNQPGDILGSRTKGVATLAPATMILSAAPGAGSITTPGVTLTYQWWLMYLGSTTGDEIITGATAQTYHLTATDATHGIGVVITVSKPGYTSVTLPISANEGYGVFPAATPVITGNQKVGTKLEVGIPGDAGWVDYHFASVSVDSVAYQWYRTPPFGTASPIAGATSSTYTLTAADVGGFVTARMVPTAAGYLSTINTTTTGTIAKGDFDGSYSADIAMTNPTTHVLTATAHGILETGYTLKYQWWRTQNFGAGTEAPIAGATAPTYTLNNTADYRYRISVQVTISKTGYNDFAITRAVGQDYSLVAQSITTIDDTTPTVGDTLTVTPASEFWVGSTPTVPDAFAYQWMRNGAAIAGATSATYTVVAADAGKTLTARVTASHSGNLPSVETGVTSTPVTA